MVQTSPSNILIIDDSEVDREIYKRYLDANTYNIHEAASGYEGIDLYKNIHPDCILLDYNMPDIAGIEILKRLSESKTTIPVVIITGQGNEEIAVNAMKNGAQDYITKKSISHESLNKVISSTIEKTRMMQIIEENNKKIKQAKELAERQRQKALKASAAKSDFLATMSHEVRTPLNGIISIAELLSHTNLDERQHNYNHLIKNSGELLLSVINDILDYSKIESKELTLEKSPIELHRLIMDVVRLVGSMAKENSIELVVDCKEDVPFNIMSDPVRLKQILLNLIGNAVKFSKAGHVIIKINVKEYSQDNVALIFKIKDSGIGIPQNRIKKIFEKFTQLDNNTTRNYGGAGLGLTIAKELVELMGGKIGVESEQNIGSTFWFTLNFSINNADYTPSPKLSPKLFQQRFLLVEDRQVSRDTLQRYFANHSLTIKAVHSAKLALQELELSIKENTPYHVILIDQDMPQMNGDQLITILRNDERLQNLTIISMQEAGITATPETLEELKSADATIYKPFFERLFFKELSDILQQQAQAKEEANNMEIPEPSTQEESFQPRILLVEDFIPNQTVAQEVLGTLGCLIDIANNGKEAINKLKENSYDLVFMDCQMPVMDGYTAIKIIREEKYCPDTPIIAMTAAAVPGDREKCLASGMDDYLTKPITTQLMIDTLHHYIPDYVTQEITFNDNQNLEESDNLSRVEENLYQSQTSLQEMFQSDMEDIRHALSHAIGDKIRFLEQASKSHDEAYKVTKQLEQCNDLLMRYIEYRVADQPKKEVDCREIIKDVVESLSKEYNTTYIKIKKMPRTILGIKKYIKKLFHYLIENALKFNDTIPELTIRGEDKETHYVFSLADNGIGVLDELKSIVFIMFQHGGHDPELYKGLGTGLALAKNIVELHEGHIWIEDNIPKGTIVYFSIKKYE